MTLQITLPFGDRKSVKNLVFTILTKEYPLKIIDLFNLIKKRYGRAVTYQAVRKAVRELEADGVLSEKNKEYAIDIDWVQQSKQLLETLAQDLRKGPRKGGEQSLAGSITVYEFQSLSEMMRFWDELVEQWAARLKIGDPNTNYYQAHHAWEVLSHLQSEEKMIRRFQSKGIRSTALITGNTPLDHSFKMFYNAFGVKTHIRPSTSSFDRGYHVGTYGHLVIHTTTPPKLAEAIEEFYQKNRSIETLDLGALTRIINTKTLVKLTVIKNAEMAQHVNNSIKSLL